MRSDCSVGEVDFWFEWDASGIEMAAGLEGSDENILSFLEKHPDYDSMVQDAWEDFVERYPHRALEMVR